MAYTHPQSALSGVTQLEPFHTQSLVSLIQCHLTLTSQLHWHPKFTHLHPVTNLLPTPIFHNLPYQRVYPLTPRTLSPSLAHSLFQPRVSSSRSGSWKLYREPCIYSPLTIRILEPSVLVTGLSCYAFCYISLFQNVLSFLHRLL